MVAETLNQKEEEEVRVLLLIKIHIHGLSRHDELIIGFVCCFDDGGK